MSAQCMNDTVLKSEVTKLNDFLQSLLTEIDDKTAQLKSAVNNLNYTTVCDEDAHIMNAIDCEEVKTIEEAKIVEETKIIDNVITAEEAATVQPSSDVLKKNIN